MVAPVISGPAVLSPAELRRYARHVILPELGQEGQARLKAGRVLLVGAGGLGSPAALYLAAAGVGTIGIVDDDTVDESNLQRQVLHGTAGVGTSKLASAEARLRDLNPHVDIETFDARLTSANAMEILGGFDIIVDGSDNFPTRYLVNDACVLLGKPDVYGSIFRFEGQASIFAMPNGPCYRCLFRDPPPPELVPSCEQAGVLGVVPGIIGSIQALETIKLLAGIGAPLVGRLLLVDTLTMQTRELALSRDPECPVCGEQPTVTELIDYEAFCGTAARERRADSIEVDPADLARELETSAVQLVDVREPWEWKIGHLSDAVLLPGGDLERGLDALERSRPVVTYCHHGARSLAAARALREAGFENVRSLRGGIDAWAREVDHSIPRY